MCDDDDADTCSPQSQQHACLPTHHVLKTRYFSLSFPRRKCWAVNCSHHRLYSFISGFGFPLLNAHFKCPSSRVKLRDHKRGNRWPPASCAQAGHGSSSFGTRDLFRHIQGFELCMRKCSSLGQGHKSAREQVATALRDKYPRGHVAAHCPSSLFNGRHGRRHHHHRPLTRPCVDVVWQPSRRRRRPCYPGVCVVFVGRKYPEISTGEQGTQRPVAPMPYWGPPPPAAAVVRADLPYRSGAVLADHWWTTAAPCMGLSCYQRG